MLRHPPIARSEPEPLAAVGRRMRSTEALAQDPLPRKNNLVWSTAPTTPIPKAYYPIYGRNGSLRRSLRGANVTPPKTIEITRWPLARDEHLAKLA